MNRELRNRLDLIERKQDALTSEASSLMRYVRSEKQPSGDGPVLWVPTVPVLWSWDMPDLGGGQGFVSSPPWLVDPGHSVELRVDTLGQTLWLQAVVDGRLSNRVQIAWTRKGLV